MAPAEIIAKLLDYNAETGGFTWKFRDREFFKSEWAYKVWNQRYPGTKAGVDSSRGYVLLTVFNKKYWAHRVAWLLVNGEWPSGDIDHIDNDKSNNRIGNLRLASHAQNGMNKPKSARNTSGLKGVVWDVTRRKWRAQIVADGKTVNLGRFDCPAAASFAYQVASTKWHREFSNSI